MSEIDWQDEAAKWKRLSRKNEAMARLNLARVHVLEVQLKRAMTPRNAHAELAALTKQINKNQRELEFYTRLMQEIPSSNRHSGRPTAQHRS